MGIGLRRRGCGRRRLLACRLSPCGGPRGSPAGRSRARSGRGRVVGVGVAHGPPVSGTWPAQRTAESRPGGWDGLPDTGSGCRDPRSPAAARMRRASSSQAHRKKIRQPRVACHRFFCHRYVRLRSPPMIKPGRPAPGLTSAQKLRRRHRSRRGRGHDTVLRRATGSIVSSGPSTSTSRFACWIVRPILLSSGFTAQQGHLFDRCQSC